MPNELAETNSGALQSAMAITSLKEQVRTVHAVMKEVMKEGEHFGTIPGCGEKKVLMKSGAEKLGFVFRLKPSFVVTQRELGNGHREYEIRTLLSDGTEGVGCCSTMEGKYRFRQGERKCPKCGKPCIIKGREDYGGGWLCFAKKGGCGEKFPDGDKSIESQSVERVEYDNPADFYNTCLKMAKKRSHVDAIITATAASDIFTQDLEENAPQAPQTAPKQQAAKQSAPRGRAAQVQSTQASDEVHPTDLKGGFDPADEYPRGEPDMGPPLDADTTKDPEAPAWEPATEARPFAIDKVQITGHKPAVGRGPIKLIAQGGQKFDLWPKDAALIKAFKALWNPPRNTKFYMIEGIEEPASDPKWPNNFKITRIEAAQ